MWKVGVDRYRINVVTPWSGPSTGGRRQGGHCLHEEVGGGPGSVPLAKIALAPLLATRRGAGEPGLKPQGPFPFCVVSLGDAASTAYRSAHADRALENNKNKKRVSVCVCVCVWM